MCWMGRAFQWKETHNLFFWYVKSFMATNICSLPYNHSEHVKTLSFQMRKTMKRFIRRRRWKVHPHLVFVWITWSGHMRHESLCRLKPTRSFLTQVSIRLTELSLLCSCRCCVVRTDGDTGLLMLLTFIHYWHSHTKQQQSTTVLYKTTDQVRWIIAVLLL